MPAPWQPLGRRYISIEVDSDEVLPPPGGAVPPPFWKNLLQPFPNLKARPIFTSLSRQRIEFLHTQAASRDPKYQARYGSKRLWRHYALEGPAGYDYTVDLAKLKQSAGTPNSGITSVRMVVAGRDPMSSFCSFSTLGGGQVYRHAAPDGIDADGVASIGGSDGAGVRFADVERGWTRDHEDLVNHAIPAPLFGSIIADSRGHGTAVLGIVAAEDNEIYCTGIAHDPDRIYLSSREPDGLGDAIGAVLEAEDGTAEGAPWLHEGDVLLLEVQDEDHTTEPGAAFNIPVECDYDKDTGTTGPIFDVIALAGTLGIVVVEAAGNGYIDKVTGVPLGKGRDLDQHPSLDPDNTVHFQESTAILVAAGLRGEKLCPESNCWCRRPSSNFGKRVNCFAQGQAVYSLWSNNSKATDKCTKIFAATSAASAIVAGAAVSVQGIARTAPYGGAKLEPKQLRALLSDKALGTQACATTRANTPIGVMPDLTQAAAALEVATSPSGVQPGGKPGIEVGHTPVEWEHAPVDPADGPQPPGADEHEENEEPVTPEPSFQVPGSAPVLRPGAQERGPNSLVERLRRGTLPVADPWPRAPWLRASRPRHVRALRRR